MGSANTKVSEAQRRDAAQVAGIALDVAVDAALEAGKKLPLVGGLVDLLCEVKKKYGELTDQVDEAGEVAAWATRTMSLLRPIRTRLSKGADGPIDDTMRGLVNDVMETIGVLLSVAAHISSGHKPAKFLRGALFKAEFESAQAAVDSTMKELDTALAIETNIMVHEVKDETTEILKRLKALAAKIDAKDADAAKKITLRALVDKVREEPARNQAALVAVAEKVIAGDGAGAAAALADAPEDVRKSVAALLAEGAALGVQSKWTEAIVAYRECIKLDPEMSQAWFALGYAYFNQNGRKNCEAQIEPYTRCIALNPSNATAYSNLGNALDEIEDYDGAEKMYRKAIALDPKYSNAHYALGILLKNVRRDYDGAEEMYRKAIVLDPSNALVHSNLGNLLKIVRKDYGAEQMYRKAIELDPKHAPAHYNLGGLLENNRKDHDGAEEMYRKAIALDPKHTSACWNLSRILENQRNDIPGAIQFTEKYIQGGNPDNDGERRLAKLRAKL